MSKNNQIAWYDSFRGNKKSGSCRM